VVKHVTKARAGFGAVREVVEMILRHNGVWDDVLRKHELS
jgi:3-deoxy-D-manno-octulosonate 8-phosphate phosphatase KdsC-like HAD superfamily phosphatase